MSARRSALGLSPLDELTVPFDAAINPDGTSDGMMAPTRPRGARPQASPNRPHKLTTYLPEHVYAWARDHAYAASCAGAPTSIADVMRLAVEQLRLRGEERVQRDLIG